MAVDHFDVEKVAESDGVVALRLVGELDERSVGRLDGALRAAAGRGSHTVVVDMADLTFIGSSGLSCLAQAAQRRRAPFRVVLRAPGDHTRKVLRITGLDRVLKII